MTQADPSWGAAGAGGSAPRRRAALVAGGVVAFVVLATVGAVSGWLLAGGSGDDLAGDPGSQGAGTTTSVAPTELPNSRPTAATPTKPVKNPAPPAGQLVLPDLVGMDFAEAREELRARDLGWRLIFSGAGGSRLVEGTDPPAGRTVKAGITVHVKVAGAAPPVAVPDVTGEVCSAAASRLVDEGLYPDYPGGRAGQVLRQEPAAGAQLHWNDRVRIYCGKAPAGEPSTAPPPA